MTPDRWEQINKLYYAALDVTEKERASFIEKGSDGDADLRREVESLLNMHAQAEGFLGRPAMQEVANALKDDPPSLVGRHLGPYHILGPLGAGGMGEVFKARDTRLNRTVAIKVLPRHLSDRMDLRQRFEREARAIASLSHPHICPLFDIGNQDGVDFLVMECLEGETLSQRLKRGSIPTEEVLRLALEITGGLDQAHRKGVTHRDLKPGNIMLTESGAKLLDFGLAKQNRPPLTRGDYRGVETATESLTGEGMLLGTLEYMAPEQLEGKEADARTDIFALGVVIYEMATGRKAFEGDSKASLIAKILTTQPPPIATVQPVSPPQLDTVVQKCLAKKPEERWQSAAEVSSELREIAEANLETLRAQKRRKEPSGERKEIESGGAVLPAVVPEPWNLLSRLNHSRALRLSLVGLLLAVVTVSLALWRVRQHPKKPREKREMSFKPLTSYSWDNPVDCAGVSTDGTYLAFCSKGKLFVQVIKTGEKRSLLLPEGFYLTKVGWFPDGTKLSLGRSQERWIQVKDQMTWQSDLSIWSLSILGGKSQMIVDHADYASVSPDGSLVAITRFDPDRQAKDIWLVSSNGEGLHKLKIAAQVGGPGPTARGPSFGGPVWSPNGQRILYFRNDDHGRSIESCDLRGERVIPFSSQATDVCVPHWSTDGRIIQLLQKDEAVLTGTTVNLWETKVDAASGRPLSEARRLTQWSGGFSFSTAGYLSMTADGRRAVVLKRNAQADVYVAELEPGGKAMKTPRRLTTVETDDAVCDWTADSRSILFESDRNGNRDLFKQDIDQTDAEAIVATSEHESHLNLSPDGAFLLYLVSEKPGQDAKRLMRIPVGGGPPERVLSGEKIKNFSCAREAKLCVVAEEVEGKQVLTIFDPLKGRGEKLPLLDYPNFEGGILSPQGRLIEKMKSGPDGLYIRVRSLTGGPVEEITFKKLTREYHLQGWSLDGKAIYVYDCPTLESDFTALYVGLDGHSQVLWKRGTSPGWTFGPPIPSPNGRYLAFTVVTFESNAWMLENF